VEDALQLYKWAMSNKAIAGHLTNEFSSRSHVIFEVAVTSAPIAAPDESRHAKLRLVDLAGCERHNQTGIDVTTSGQLWRASVVESVAINKSLMTLRQVIARRGRLDAAACITSNRTSAPAIHIPYRDSKLTSLLQDGLSGSGRMLMIACLSPCKLHMGSNVSTLEYASLVCFLLIDLLELSTSSCVAIQNFRSMPVE
jgi:hypothetical protein